MSAHTEQRSLPQGSRLGPYEIVASIGAGGMGEVFRARDTRLKRDVAVKVLPKDFAADAERLRRFEQEAKTLAALNHPNVLTIHDAGIYEGAPYLVSELLEGRTLHEELRGGALPVRKATDYALQIAQGLAAAHGKGVVHRDLKPDNLFVTRDGRVKILDFGLAKLREVQSPRSGVQGPADPDAPTVVEPAADHTEPGRVMGTPSYMAPEQVRGEAVDQRADIFAFGCVLYEMLGGRRAFRRDTPVESMNAVLNDTPPELGTANPDIPVALTRIVHRCLEKEPDNRFQSAKDLAYAIEAAREHSSAARSASPPNMGVAWSRRRVVSAVAAVVLCAVAAGWWVVLQQSDKATKSVGQFPANHPGSTSRTNAARASGLKSIAVKPLDYFSGDTNQAYLADGMTEALTRYLSDISALHVRSRSTVMTRKGRRETIGEFAKAVDTEAVVEGSIQREGNRLLVTVQLIEAATDRHLWATNYNREMGDFFKVQSEVAQAIAQEINVRLTPQDQTRLANAPSSRPEVIEAYLRGRWQLDRRTVAGFTNAIANFEKVIALDSSYAPGYAGLASAYAMQPFFMLVPGTNAAVRSKRLAGQALALDPGSAEAFSTLGFVQMWADRDWAASEASFQKAINSNAGFAQAHFFYSNLLARRGRYAEALDEIGKAIALEPNAEAFQMFHGLVHFWGGDRKRGIEITEAAARLFPDFRLLTRSLAMECFAEGDYARVITLLNVPGHEADDLWQAYLGVAYAHAGRRLDAERILRQVQGAAATRYVSPVAFMVLHAALGDMDRAFEMLEAANRERHPFISGAAVQVEFYLLKDDPRFAEFLKREGLAIENPGR